MLKTGTKKTRICSFSKQKNHCIIALWLGTQNDNKERNKIMKTKIYCTKKQSKHNFYACVNGKNYYLFSQDFRRGVENYFCGGKVYDEAIKHSKSKGDNALKRTMDKIPSYVRYAEKYYGIIITNRSEKKANKEKNTKLYA